MDSKNTKLIAIGAAVAVVLVIGIILLTRGGKKDLPLPPSGDPKDGDNASAAFIVLQVVERHRDTFPKPLGNLSSEAADPPFIWDEGGVSWADGIANETDADRLRGRGLILETPGVAPAKCQVLVIYSIVYTGTGRQFDAHRYYAFEKLPATIAVPAGFTGDKLEYDLETADNAFPYAAMAVRLLPKDATVQLASVDNDKIAVTFDGVSQTLAAGETASLKEASRTLPVTELAVTSRPINDKNAPAVEFSPRVDHGLIQFSTVLSLQLLGKAPIMPAVIESEGDLP